MAQDVREARAKSSDLSLFSGDHLMETSPVSEWTSGPSNISPIGQNGNTPFVGPLRNDITDLTARLSQVIEGGENEMQGPSQNPEKKLRTLPAWIQSVEYQEDDIEATATSRLLPAHPGDAVVAQHNHSPYSTSKSGRGEGREARGEISQARESRWKDFSKTTAYPREHGAEEKLIEPDEDTEDPLKRKRRREMWLKRFHSTLLKSPIVPLIFRLTVWCFSLTALALGGSIQNLSESFNHPQGPSALMAIIVDAVALVYLVYITWDEYTSKPLGLRSPSAKARLILLDIFFIVFDSANLSLAFESLSSAEGACTLTEINQTVAPKNDSICDRQIALACVLLVALIAWLITFSISVLRLVERVKTK
ncbi:hypothetical protein ARAM_000626 [Aspergillus rambellii]|uniref:Regulator of phospholipase D SRF1 n=1 Tax=Aspergillus rambellii TaxID=308745 RepID=A0A0F8UMY9_9EURO|nr:hypothetical protein ARAM_000626 [Aspergillus rambellii]